MRIREGRERSSSLPKNTSNKHEGVSSEILKQEEEQVIIKSFKRLQSKTIQNAAGFPTQRQRNIAKDAVTSLILKSSMTECELFQAHIEHDKSQLPTQKLAILFAAIIKKRKKILNNRKERRQDDINNKKQQIPKIKNQRYKIIIFFSVLILTLGLTASVKIYSDYDTILTEEQSNKKLMEQEKKLSSQFPSQKNKTEDQSAKTKSAAQIYDKKYQYLKIEIILTSVILFMMLCVCICLVGVCSYWNCCFKGSYQRDLIEINDEIVQLEQQQLAQT